MVVQLTGKAIAGPGVQGRSTDAHFAMEDGHVGVRIETYPRSSILEAPAQDIAYIAIEDGGTRTNVGAVVAFGVFGLGAKRQWTTVTIGFQDGDMVLAIREPLQYVRTEIKKGLVECPELDGRIVEGPPPVTPLQTGPDVSNAASGGAAALDRLERLAALLDRGTIDAEEFALLKAALIDEAS